ncbi:aminotransferase class V-fold PLP-dependent enzyme, partial [Pseudoalteromonas sp. S3173]|uniref:aminotransferase class V-fold PLP-dependent enzyme n=1 Tax=Pseudoalteromonas sp. S3173 TaxID=579531 RepID=UPI00110D1957
QGYFPSVIDGVIVSQVYSNTVFQAPINDIVALSKVTYTLSIIDVAQSAGVIPVDITALNADFLIGSSVKWRCGGPGAGYLWL